MVKLDLKRLKRRSDRMYYLWGDGVSHPVHVLSCHKWLFPFTSQLQVKIRYNNIKYILKIMIYSNNVI